MKTRKTSVLVAGALGAVGSVLIPGESLGQTCPGEIPGLVCVCDPTQTSDITVCVEWTNPAPPVHNVNFFVTYQGCAPCPTEPDIELRSGGEWTIRARLPNGAPGDIFRTSSPWPEDFNVRLGRGNSDPGAANIESITLDPQGVGSDDNQSSILGVCVGAFTVRAN